MIHDVPLGMAHVYLFNESWHAKHQEGSSEESAKLNEICREQRIPYCLYSDKGQYILYYWFSKAFTHTNCLPSKELSNPGLC